MGLIFVDCEAYGGCPALGRLTEFGAVTYPKQSTFHGFHGVIVESITSTEEYDNIACAVFVQFDAWLAMSTKGRPIMVSDNPAFDFMWIADGFLRHLGRNPFGHSARRLSDFYAGLCGNFYETQNWKHLRTTPHDHNPVHDALGNLEAFERLLAGER